MTTRPDPDRSIAAWLEAEAPDRAPDRLLATTRERLRTTRQRPSLRLARRIADMNTYAKFAIGAAAVAVVAVVGFNLMPTSAQQGAPSTAPSPLPSSEAAPSPAASEAASVPQPPVEVTGRFNCGPPVASSRAGNPVTIDLEGGMVLTRSRNGAWSQTVTMSDPRLEGTTFHTWESDDYRDGGVDPATSVVAGTRRIENEQGAWVGRAIGATFADGTSIGQNLMVFTGEGGYAGMVAVLEETPVEGACAAEVRGVIFEGAPVPEPFIPE